MVVPRLCQWLQHARNATQTYPNPVEGVVCSHGCNHPSREWDNQGTFIPTAFHYWGLMLLPPRVHSAAHTSAMTVAILKQMLGLRKQERLWWVKGRQAGISATAAARFIPKAPKASSSLKEWVFFWLPCGIFVLFCFAFAAVVFSNYLGSRGKIEWWPFWLLGPRISIFFYNP